MECQKIKHLLNEEIECSKVRIISDGVDEVMTTEAALELAYSRDCDLVLMSSSADIPVCKIMDYAKFVYNEQKKQKSSTKQKVELKEVRTGNHIAENDMKTKANTIARILSEGDKVKITVVFKGREARLVESGKAIIEKILEFVTMDYNLDKSPYIEGNRACAIVCNKK